MVTGRSDTSADAVIVGAGHNGLVAANILADAGWDVVVCEATDQVGGAVRSAQVTSAGFVTDLFSAFYPLAAASPVLDRLDLSDFGLQWSHAPSVLAHLFPDGRCAVVHHDVAATARSMDAFAAGDGQAWSDVVAEWDAISGPFLEALFTPFPPLRAGQRLARTLGAGGSIRFARMAALSVRRFGDERFAGAGAPMVLAGNAMHADLTPQSAGSALYGWLLAMVGQTMGFPVPVSGAGVLSDALTARLISAGGQIRRGCPVERIVITGNVATGVVLAGGETIGARRAVLADVAAPILYDALVGHDRLPARFVADLRHFEWDTPTMKIDWALSGRVPWTSPEAAGAGTVHLGVDMNGLSDYTNDLACQRIPHNPFVVVGQMTTADASRSPAGTESAWAYTHLPIGLDLSADDIRRHVERVELLLERHAPGFADLVLARHVQSPSDLHDVNPNLVHGAINGGTAQLHQQLIFRRVPGLGGSATPVDRLFLAGSSAHPGGGVHGAPGSNAARAALARVGPTGALRRAATAILMNRIYRPIPQP